jgi:hypothetical protein
VRTEDVKAVKELMGKFSGSHATARESPVARQASRRSTNALGLLLVMGIVVMAVAAVVVVTILRRETAATPTQLPATTAAPQAASALLPPGALPTAPTEQMPLVTPIAAPLPSAPVPLSKKAIATRHHRPTRGTEAPRREAEPLAPPKRDDKKLDDKDDDRALAPLPQQ